MKIHQPIFYRKKILTSILCVPWSSDSSSNDRRELEVWSQLRKRVLSRWKKKGRIKKKGRRQRCVKTKVSNKVGYRKEGLGRVKGSMECHKWGRSRWRQTTAPWRSAFDDGKHLSIHILRLTNSYGCQERDPYRDSCDLTLHRQYDTVTIVV